MEPVNITLEILDEYGEQFEFALTEVLTRAIEHAARHENILTGEVVISLVDDEAIHELNRTYRGKDAPTDVLSFAMMEEGNGEPEIFFDPEDAEGLETDDMLGDIIISVPTAKRQAAEYGHSVERELAFLAVHGFLHLVGYDHGTEEEEKEMFSRQDAIMEAAGITRG
ncbi:putative rRNA maturation factor [Tumebacillus sp. BK434]|uniref:rRNA maturation RNase YbeY n=1 Tax=Tumebacillus sp. BK434 TaxID=2512169 RepID=UPI00105304C8|nr:rRNA maturation RNase YbeY [Tumebacillus sp. BK434]TCP53323.1 putative rRNA maturation factor [Tumebacillus sp. BK434]